MGSDIHEDRQEQNGNICEYGYYAEVFKGVHLRERELGSDCRCDLLWREENSIWNILHLTCVRERNRKVFLLTNGYF